MSGPITLIWVWLERPFPPANFSQRWWRQKWKKGRRSSRPFMGGTGDNGLTCNSSFLYPGFPHRTSVEGKIGQDLSSPDTPAHNVWETARTRNIKFNSNTRYRVQVVPLPLSPSCVTGKKTGVREKKNGRKNPWGRAISKHASRPKNSRAIFFLAVTRPTKRKGYYAQSTLIALYFFTSFAWLLSRFFFPNWFLMLSFFISPNTASTIGTIMAVVAVLLIHMERNAVVSINPSIKLQNKIKQCIRALDLKSQAEK